MLLVSLSPSLQLERTLPEQQRPVYPAAAVHCHALNSVWQVTDTAMKEVWHEGFCYRVCAFGVLLWLFIYIFIDLLLLVQSFSRCFPSTSWRSDQRSISPRISDHLEHTGFRVVPGVLASAHHTPCRGGTQKSVLRVLSRGCLCSAR